MSWVLKDEWGSHLFCWSLREPTPERSPLPSPVVLQGSTSYLPSPEPYLALWAQVKAPSKPSWRQATVAS